MGEPDAVDDREAMGQDEVASFAMEDILAALKELYWEDFDWEEFGDQLGALPLKELWELHKQVEGFYRAAKDLRERIRKEIAAELGPAGSARLDDYLATVAPNSRTRVTDVEGLVDWLGEDWITAYNPSYVKITGLRAIAKDRGEPADSAIEQFFTREDAGEPSLKLIPVDKVKYAQEMANMETRNTTGRR